MPKTFVVLGMHRSATSLIARGLATNEVHMGNRLLGARRSNPLGHYEDLDILELNDDILTDAGGSWKRPPPNDRLYRSIGLHKLEVARLVADRAAEGHSLWGWKEPRTALTWPAWDAAFGPDDDLHLIAIMRRPTHVARSLASRNNFTAEQANRLGRRYNTAILTALANHVGLQITVH
jgi:hypothetical protein